MTDQELIARLREGATWDDDVFAANRIEELVEERDTARRLLAAATQMQTETQVKLTKAVEMLILCDDMFDEVAHPSDPLSVMIKTTLAELEGK